MTVKKPTDIASSVRQRLLNISRDQGKDYQLLITRFVLERLLFRLGRSEYKDQFILKGAMLFALWDGEPHRATRDIDLLGYGESGVAKLVQSFQDICCTQVEDDGVTFLPESAKGIETRDDQEYDGVRVIMEARLGRARIPVQVDIGFGDSVIPAAELSVFPVMLGFPAPYIRIYPRETVVAEKFQAMVHLGMANSRMKDIYDLRFLAATFPFTGDLLAKAITATFVRRNTIMTESIPLAFTPEFSEDSGKRMQWRAFLNRNQLVGVELSLTAAISEILNFLQQPFLAAVRRDAFDFYWPPGGPWHRA